MENQFSRTEFLIGQQNLNKLKNSRVAIFGIGGVGGYTCEALVRSGIENIDIIDDDVVSITNINRQIIALHSTIGKQKVDVMKERLKDINPKVNVNVHKCFFLPENSQNFPFEEYDYVIDAVDTVTAKIELVMKCKEMGIPIISSMGAGNKLDASAFKVADVYNTKMDTLAKVMRRELKARGIKKLKVVYSEEKPIDLQKNVDMEDLKENENPEKTFNNKRVPGSISFVPSVVGLIIAGEVIKDILKA